MPARTDDERSQDRFTEMARVAKRSQRLGTGIIVTLAVLVAVVSSAVSAWNTTELRKLSHDTQELLRSKLPLAAALEVEKKLKEREREFGTDSIRCLLAELAAHREMTARAHQSFAKGSGFVYEHSPELEPPTVPHDVTRLCEPFYPPEGRP